MTDKSWKDVVFEVIQKRKGREIKLQKIYHEMLGHPLITAFHMQPWKTGKQPKYQCWIRRVLTDLVKEGSISRPRKGVYKSN